VVVFPLLYCSRKTTLRHADSGISVRPCVSIDEADAVVDGMVRLTLRLEIAVRRSAIADDRIAVFDPVTCYGHQCVVPSVPRGKRKVLQDSQLRQTATDH
jgi:hypothetical protein